MDARRLLITSALALTACDRVSGLSDFEIGTGGQGGTAPQGGAAGSPDGGAPPCLQPPADSTSTTITWTPNTLTTADAPLIHVTDTATPFTYVSLLLCTPAGPRLITEVHAIQCSSLRNTPPCTWTFSTSPLPFGTTQASFAIMMQATTVETTDILVIR